jgi:hypothetical protein
VSIHPPPPPPYLSTGLTDGIGRKLQDIRQDLVVLGQQGIVKGFLMNAENASKLGGLVEDIRDAVMAYQVCLSNDPFLPCLKSLTDVIATRLVRQELPAHRESHPTTFSSRGLTDG